MKGLEKALNSLGLFIALMLTNIFVYAQEKSMDVNVDVNKGGGGNWYTSPAFLVIGGAIFLLLLVALLRGGRTSD
jgi:hypothetical protein